VRGAPRWRKASLIEVIRKIGIVTPVFTLKKRAIKELPGNQRSMIKKPHHDGLGKL
jgi:hypothetical protein